MPTLREAIALYQQSLQISESIGNIQLNNRILQQNKMLMMKIKNIIAPSSLVGEGVGGWGSYLLFTIGLINFKSS